MALLDNRPTLAQLKNRLIGVDLTDYPNGLLQELLDASIAWIEDEATTSLNGRQVTELYDGNTTNHMVVRKRPVTSIILLQVETPILGYIRTYQPSEIKLYRKQGDLKVFTFKLAAEMAMFNTLDYQAWGTIFPPLPQAVHVQYTYGYPQYDPDQGVTVLDGASGGLIVQTGDQRDPEELNWVSNLQQAAICDAAASFLGQTAGLKAGFLQSVSFDGYAKSANPAAYGQQVQALIARRDELMKRRRRLFHMATIG